MRAEWRAEKVLSSGVTGLKSQFLLKNHFAAGPAGLENKKAPAGRRCFLN
jgi:hypothetical protein